MGWVKLQMRYEIPGQAQGPFWTVGDFKVVFPYRDPVRVRVRWPSGRESVETVKNELHYGSTIEESWGAPAVKSWMLHTLNIEHEGIPLQVDLGEVEIEGDDLTLGDAWQHRFEPTIASFAQYVHGIERTEGRHLSDEEYARLKADFLQKPPIPTKEDTLRGKGASTLPPP